MAWTFYLVLGLLGLVWLGWKHEVLEIGLLFDVSTVWFDLILGVASGLALVAAWESMRRRFPGAGALEKRLVEMIGPIRSDEAIALAVVSGVAEETFFRGAVQGSWGFLPATLLFAVLHSGPGREFRFWTVFAAIAGLLFGGLFLWRGRLIAPIVAHVVVNGINLYRIANQNRAEEGDEPATS